MLIEFIQYIAEAVPLWRASEDAMLPMFTADLRMYLPQPNRKEQ